MSKRYRYPTTCLICKADQELCSEFPIDFQKKGDIFSPAIQYHSKTLTDFVETEHDEEKNEPQRLNLVNFLLRSQEEM